jgi:two-component system chemotaxis response regulator CheB
VSFKAIVIGASAGGMEAIKSILSRLPADFSLPIIIVQHMKAGKSSNTEDYFKRYCKINIKEAESNMKIKKGVAYFAPPNYHLLVEKNKTLTLSVEEKMNYSRPSIDVLFETAADVYKKELIGVILTGASSDGSNGLLEIKNKGGLCIVQDPKTALMNIMPSEALKKVEADYVLSLEDIADALIGFKDLKCKG